MDYSIELANELGVRDELEALAAGEEVQEVAEPASDDEQAGGEEREVAEPDGAEAQNKDEESEVGSGETAPSEDSKYAAARRRAEAERDAAVASVDERIRQAVDAERARQQAELADFFAQANLIDTSKNTPIRNMEDFRAWRENYDAIRRQRIIEKSGLSDDEFKSFVESLPDVQAARATAETAAREAARAEIAAEIKAIGALDPDIKSAADLVASPSYKQVYELVGKGVRLSDAYKLVNIDKLAAGLAERQVQAARNAAAGKQHMTRTVPKSRGVESVPDDIAAEYRALMPDATEDEIRRHYNAYLQGK